MFDLQILGVQYAKPDEFGDFSWMCEQDDFKDALFIFNDNENHHFTDVEGGGNAIMRKYNKYSQLAVPRSAGIPTGCLGEFHCGGYDELNTHVKKQIDDAIQEIKQLIHLHHYPLIIFSCDKNGFLGTGIFKVDPDVLKYITQQIYSLTINPVQNIRIETYSAYRFKNEVIPVIP